MEAVEHHSILRQGDDADSELDRIALQLVGQAVSIPALVDLAKALAERARRTCEVITTNPGDGLDFNDVLLRRA